MNEQIKNLKYNSVLGLFYQIILIISGLILPRFFLKCYGSDIYGLISSITQFLSFINLCDMGIGAVISSALYKPLANKNMDEVSKIFLYSKKFFRIIGFIFIIYIFFLSILYPKFNQKSFTYDFYISLILIMSFSQFGQFFLGMSYQILLNADQKSYIQLFINSLTLILNTILSIIIIGKGYSIQLVKLITSLLYLLRPIFMYIYVRKKYCINYNIKITSDVIPQKWNGVVQHISYMIYENTDVAILTIFSSLSDVSIYSVYILIVSSVKTLINSATTGIQALFGNMISLDEKLKLKNAYDFYDWIIHTICTLLFTITGILIVPFVLLYTKGINDANYNVKLFSVLITICYGINVIRNSMYTIIKSAGHYKSTQNASMAEAFINLSVSIIFVSKYGLVGVTIGTLLATVFFSIYEVLYLSRHIIERNIFEFFKQVIIDFVSVLVMLYSCSFITVGQTSYFDWIKSAIFISGICLIESIIFQFIFFKKNIKKIKDYFGSQKNL